MAQSFINDRATDYQSLKNRSMGGALSRPRSDHFDVLNRYLRPGLVAPGQLVIVPDGHSVNCSVEEAWLMRHAEEVRRHLEMSAAGGAVVIDNYDLLQSFMANGSIGIGSATSAWARHLNEVAQTLEDIERLHQRLKAGGLDRAAFIQQRQALFRGLEVQLQSASRVGAGLRGNESLKKVLGISTKSYLHKGEIAGYAKRIRETAQTSKWLGRGTYVGLALDVGVLGAELTRRACTIFLGVATRGSGALTCAIVGGAAGGYAGGNLGGDGGKFLGGKVIEMEGDLIFQPEGA